MRRLRWILVLVLAGVLGAAIPVALASGWGSSYVYLSTDAGAQTQEAPAVALGPDGQVGAVWLDDSATDTNPSAALLDGSFDDGHGFSPVTVSATADPLTFNGGDHPQVAEDAAGDTVGVWTDGGVLTAGYRAGGATAFTDTTVDTTIPAGDTDELPRLAMDPAGDAVVAWEQCDTSASTCSVDDAVLAAGSTTFGAPAQLQSGLTNSVDQPAPDVAINAGGAAAIVWIDTSGTYGGAPGYDFIDYSYSTDVGSTPFTAATEGYSESDDPELNEPVVAIAGDGNAAVAWHWQSGSGGGNPPSFVYEADLPQSVAEAAGPLVNPGMVGTDALDGTVLGSAGQTDPAITMKAAAAGDDTTAVGLYDASADAVAAFIRPSTGYDRAAWNSYDSMWAVANQGWIQESPADTAAPQLALSSAAPGSDGPLTVAWSNGGSFEAITSDASGSFADAAAQPLASGSTSDNPHCPAGTTLSCARIASDPNGDIAALWQQDDSSGNEQVAAGCYQAGATSGGGNTGAAVPADTGADTSGCDALTTTTSTGTTTTTTGTTTTGGTPTPTPTTATTSSTPMVTTATAPAGTTSPTPTPALARSIVVQTKSGTVSVRLPGSKKLVPLVTLAQIPNGSVINATHGRVTLSFALPDGGTETASFWGGEFQVTQAASGAVRLQLAGGSFAGCPRPSHRKRRHNSRPRTAGSFPGVASAGAASPVITSPVVASAAVARSKKPKRKRPGSTVRSLWSNARGDFTTKGRNGSAAVLGTTWLTRDQCDGTYFYVKRTSHDRKGAILVTVLHPHRHRVRLRRGHHLLAPAPGYQTAP